MPNILTIPPSNISMLAPVASTIALMFLPCGPIKAPVLSGLIFIVNTLGALGFKSFLGSGRTSLYLFKINNLPSFA